MRVDLDEYFEARQGEFFKEALQACLKASSPMYGLSEDSGVGLSILAGETARQLALHYRDRALVYAVSLSRVFGSDDRMSKWSVLTVDHLIDGLDLEVYRDGSRMSLGYRTDVLEPQVGVEVDNINVAYETGLDAALAASASKLAELSEQLVDRRFALGVTYDKFAFLLETFAQAEGRDVEQVMVERYLSGEEVPHSDFKVIQPGYWEL